MGGAIPGKDFLVIMRQAGFADVEMVSETGFNSSAVTRGVLFRAVKPAVGATKFQILQQDCSASVSEGKHQEGEAALADAAPEEQACGT